MGQTDTKHYSKDFVHYLRLLYVYRIIYNAILTLEKAHAHEKITTRKVQGNER